MIALVTMTRNGLTKLPRLFASVQGFCNKAIILDTGSTDGTQEFLASSPLPAVKWANEPFVNFEVSRNRLMAMAKDEADWLLLLDDDMALNWTADRQTDVLASLDPKVDAYLMKHAGGLEYWVTRLVRGDRLWTYKGVTHEYLVGGGCHNPKLTGVEILHYFNHGPEKFERDLRLLTADIARDPNDHRTIFYIANTLRDMGQNEAAVRFYKMRALMGGWDEEVYISFYEAARLSENPAYMAMAYKYRPSRAEASAWLAKYWARQGDMNLAELWESIRAKTPYPENDVLFVIKSAYGPRQS